MVLIFHSLSLLFFFFFFFFLPPSQGHRIVLTVQSSKNSQYFRSWELYFLPNPSEIITNYKGATLTIYVPLPSPPPSEKPFKVGNFVIQGSSSGIVVGRVGGFWFCLVVWLFGCLVVLICKIWHSLSFPPPLSLPFQEETESSSGPINSKDYYY